MDLCSMDSMAESGGPWAGSPPEFLGQGVDLLPKKGGDQRSDVIYREPHARMPSSDYGFGRTAATTP